MLEGVFARGDRTLADVLERAFQRGARFDSWEDQVRLDVWQEAFEHFGIEPGTFLGTIPVTARLPWDHIDVGLEDGFLVKEYRKSLASRLSPPCGKVAGTFVHHDNIEDAEEDRRRLVCYDCGVACDMTQMRQERIGFLDTLDSHRRLPVVQAAEEEAADDASVEEAQTQKRRQPPGHGQPLGGHRVRFRFEKTGPMALLGHLDLIREVPRVFRRAGVELEYTKGFHPKPDMSFTAALPLGVMSLDEYVDIRLAELPTSDQLREIVVRMTERSPGGLRFLEGAVLSGADRAIGTVIDRATYLLVTSRSAAPFSSDADWTAHCAEVLERTAIRVQRKAGGKPRGRGFARLGKVMDIRPFLIDARPLGPRAQDQLRRAGLIGDLVGVEVTVVVSQAGGVKTSELARLLLTSGPMAEDVPPHQAVRTSMYSASADAREITPLDIVSRETPQPPTVAV